MLPELLEFVNERVLQLVERREHGIGEVLAQMPEDLLSRVQFRTIRWQIERVHSRCKRQEHSAARYWQN